jgi:hypothetical protein
MTDCCFFSLDTVPLALSGEKFNGGVLYEKGENLFGSFDFLRPSRRQSEK